MLEDVRATMATRRRLDGQCSSPDMPAELNPEAALSGETTEIPEKPGITSMAPPRSSACPEDA